MSDFGEQLKNFGIQLQRLAMQIQNLGMQTPLLLQNIKMQMLNISDSIITIGAQILNIGTNLSNNFNMNFPMNYNIFQRMNMINNNCNCNALDNHLFTIVFENGRTCEKTSIITSHNTTVEELFNLFIIKKGLKSNYLEKNYFLCNAQIINPKEKKTILNYGIKNGGKISISETQYLLGGP